MILAYLVFTFAQNTQSRGGEKLLQINSSSQRGLREDRHPGKNNPFQLQSAHAIRLRLRRYVVRFLRAAFLSE